MKCLGGRGKEKRQKSEKGKERKGKEKKRKEKRRGESEHGCLCHQNHQNLLWLSAYEVLSATNGYLRIILLFLRRITLHR